MSDSPLVIDALPTLSWVPVGGEATVEQSTQTLTMRSAGGVDWTNDATGGDQQHRAASLAFVSPSGPFTLSAKVSIHGDRTTFDAGALSIWSDENHWAKLCFENSPDGDTMVVSVVTNTYSDDANSHLVADPGIYLRVASLGNNAWAFHSSTDGVRWNFVRLFNLPVPTDTPTYVGFLTQAPFGEHCDAVFSDIRFSHGLLGDTRNGS
jgi:regulation of enolase protein 1 (concanavalin A-like superfamily)